MIFNDLNTEWGQLLQPTQDIMEAYITLQREEEFQSRFREHEETIKPLWTRFQELFLQQVKGHRNKNRKFSQSQLLQPHITGASNRSPIWTTCMQREQTTPS